MNARITEIRGRKQALDEALSMIESTQAALYLTDERFHLLQGLATALAAPISFPTDAEEAAMEAGKKLVAAIQPLWDEVKASERRLWDARDSLRSAQTHVESDLYSERGAA